MCRIPPLIINKFTNLSNDFDMIKVGIWANNATSFLNGTLNTGVAKSRNGKPQKENTIAIP